MSKGTKGFKKGNTVNKGKKHTKGTKEKMKKAHLGTKHTEITKKKMSKNHSGKGNPMFGKHHSEIVRKKMKRSGKNHWNWQGGISNYSYPIDWTETLRQSIRERDNYTCQIPGCNKKQGDRAHSVHHIDYNKLNNNPNNLITLCINCHIKTNYNRKYWINYFKKLYDV